MNMSPLSKSSFGDFVEMATKKGRSALFEAQKFAKSLGELIDSLPSDAGKQQIASQLEALIQFLITLKSRLEKIPTQQEAEAARMAVNRLQSLFAEAKSNPVIGAAIGIRTTAPRQKPPTITSEEIESAKLAVARFGSLPIDEIRAALEEMSVRDLQVVANAIGVRTTQRTARESLVHQVATRITNTRGYRALRDGTS
jgi:hypothetical protein